MEFSKKSEGRSLDPLAKILGGRKQDKEPVQENGTSNAENGANGTPATPPAAGPSGSSTDPLEAIRSAVFGDTIEGLGGKFDRLERDVRQSEDEMKKHVADGFSSFKSFLHRELKTAIDRINEDAAERQRQFEKSQEEMENQVRKAEERVTELEKELREVNTKTNEEMIRRAETLAKQIEDTGRRVYDRAHTEITDIESSAASRTELREMFREMGERFSKEKSKMGA